ncbi:hypothetical protein S83_039306 [Arachis hypogaea]
MNSISETVVFWLVGKGIGPLLKAVGKEHTSAFSFFFFLSRKINSEAQKRKLAIKVMQSKELQKQICSDIINFCSFSYLGKKAKSWKWKSKNFAPCFIGFFWI